MNDAEIIIIGLGAAGTWAASEAVRLGKEVLILDVGYDAPSKL